MPSRNARTREDQDPGVRTPARARLGGQRRLPPLLRRVWYGLNQAFRRRIAHLGITPDQYTILRWLHEARPGGLTQRELAELMASDPNTVTALMQRLERMGWVTRAVDPADRRARRVALCPDGLRAFRAARGIARRLEREVLAALPTEARESFLMNLEILGDAAQAAAVTAVEHP